MQQPRKLRWQELAKEAFVGLVIAGVTIIVCLVGLEFYFRYQLPFGSIAWPYRFDPKVGFTFIPGAEIRWTNNLDYWTVQYANRWGFLDREPDNAGVTSNPACRVAFIGDSFVEAAQVPVSDKVQVVIEKLGRQRVPALNIAGSAFGYSGTGQLNQLPFYDEFARQLQPNVVVLVFVGNDISNNSKVLEALRNGWDPDHAPRVFASHIADGKIALQPIDPNWREATLRVPLSWDSRALYHAPLMQRSAFYRWLYAKLTLLHPSIANFISGGDAGFNVVDFRARQLSERPNYRGILDGWDPSREPGIDDPFFSREPMAPVFKEAIEYTGFAFDQFLERARRDKFKLVILAESGLGEQRYYLSPLAKARDIPIIDQRQYIESVGGDVGKVHFPHDGHWSPQGHRWAAEAVLNFLAENPLYCPSSISTTEAR